MPKINTVSPSSGKSLWASAAANIDPLTVKTGDIVTSCPSQGGDACFGNLGLTTCEHAVTQFNLSAYTGLSQVTVSALTVGTFNPKDVAVHSAWGPDASLVTDGVFAPDGTTWNNPSFAVVLPFADERSAITVDLGSKIAVCGTGACGGAPTVQADRHNMSFEWWDDSTSQWKVWGTTVEQSGSGLITRNVTPTAGTTAANFTTQYVRLWPTTGADDNSFSVSEIQIRDATGSIVSTGTVAIGPRPYLITDGNDNGVPKDGTTWNNPTYAVVLRDGGPGNALAIDLGNLYALCSTGACQPSIQADKNVYQVDYSLDGTNWIPWAQLPAASSDGLQTRPLPPPTNGKAVTARYVRIWGCPPSECPASGDTNFSVSEVTLMNTGTPPANVSAGALTFGPERVATNGETKSDGGSWDDARYTRILSPCLSNAKEKCVQLGTTLPKTGALYVDLTATFPISGILFQGDRHQFQVDYSTDGRSWQALWTVPSYENESGLVTRNDTFPNSTFPNLPNARYLAIYGTAGDDSNYSVSTLTVYTQIANTACTYTSGANSGFPFACTYDAPLVTQLTVPSPGLSVAFTIDSASTYLRCTNGTTTANTTVASIPDGTTCTATLNVTQSPAGGYCSGSCSSGQFVATNVDIDTPTFTLSNLQCNHSTGDLTDGLTQVALQAGESAVQGLFNGLMLNPKAGPLVPNGSCPATLDTSNAQLRGVATQVGSIRDNGHVALTGEAKVSVSANLDALGFTLEQILYERGGVEELVRTARRSGFAPIQLVRQNGSTANRAVYATLPNVVPSARATLSRSKTGSIQFDVQIARARMPTLPSCGNTSRTAQLATRFTLDDGGDPIVVRALQSWQCQGNVLNTL